MKILKNPKSKSIWNGSIYTMKKWNDAFLYVKMRDYELRSCATISSSFRKECSLLFVIKL